MKTINTVSKEKKIISEMDRRKTVLDIVKKNPGIRFNEIMRVSNIRNGTLSHYVKKLEEEESIELERTPRVTRLYPSGISSKEAKICKYLTMDTQKKIILFLLSRGNATSLEVKDFIKKSPSVVSVNLNDLFKEKIIEKKYDIPSNRYSLRNSTEIEGILNEYYPNLIENFSNNKIEIM